jgi:hypothetical protein
MAPPPTLPRRLPLALLLLLLTTTTTPTASAMPLCIFDMDRTLTGQQGSGGQGSGNNACPHDRSFHNIKDTAYKTSGALTASELALHLAQTWCGKHALLGIISAGHHVMDAQNAIGWYISGNNSNSKMPWAQHLFWADAKAKKAAPMIFNSEATGKYKHVHLIIDYYETKGVTIKPENMYYFDDISVNVKSWKGRGFGGAFQLSCATRATDPSSGKKYEIGRCGGTSDEVKKYANKKGCHLCHGAAC